MNLSRKTDENQNRIHMKSNKSLPIQAAALNRREFVQTVSKATLAAAATTAFPFVSRGRVIGANDRIGVGFIGVGGRGNSHLSTVQKLIAAGENLQIVAA